jgi:hypothetical protein
LDYEGAVYRVEEQAQQNPQPGEDASKVVAGGGEDDVGGIAFAA